MARERDTLMAEMLEDDEQDTEGQAQSSAHEEAEPGQRAPGAHEPERTHDEQYDDAEFEGEQQAIFEELSDAESVTADDLRRFAGPDGEGMSDQQLLGMWGQAQKEAGIAPAGGAAQLPFPVYNQKGEAIPPDKLTLQDLMDGKAFIAYQALGKEQRKALTDLIRTAANGHYNERRMTSLEEQRQQVFNQYQQTQGKVTAYEQERTVWAQAMEAAARGDRGPIERLIQAYTDAMSRPQQAPQALAPEAVQAQQEAAGLRLWHEHIVPQGHQLAQKYGANPTEVVNGIQWFLKRDANFLTPQRFQEILAVDVPAWLEQAGYRVGQTGGRPGNPNPGNGGGEVAELRRTVAALQAQMGNTGVERLREKRRNAPPAGGGVPSGAGESMPSFRSRQEMKDWLQR